ncbi:MAG: hypothetical protein OXP73_08425 [Chloroflexota bacterium]|nr:hypothetical protein [Chloroflexota bacterium]
MQKFRAVCQFIIAISQVVIAVCLAGWSIAAIWVVREAIDEFRDAIDVWNQILARISS